MPSLPSSFSSRKCLLAKPIAPQSLDARRPQLGGYRCRQLHRSEESRPKRALAPERFRTNIAWSPLPATESFFTWGWPNQCSPYVVVFNHCRTILMVGLEAHLRSASLVPAKLFREAHYFRSFFRTDGSRHQGPFCPNRLLAVNSKPALRPAPAALPARGEATGRDGR